MTKDKNVEMVIVVIAIIAVIIGLWWILSRRAAAAAPPINGGCSIDPAHPNYMRLLDPSPNPSLVAFEFRNQNLQIIQTIGINPLFVEQALDHQVANGNMNNDQRVCGLWQWQNLD